MEENKNEEEVKTEKKNKKGIVIAIILILLLILGGIGGYFLYNNLEDNETVGTVWGDRYYEYLEKAQEAEDKNKYGFEEGAKEQKIRFLQSNNSDNPNMVINYEKDGEKRVSIYFIIEEKIEYYNPKKKSKVKLLYNIEDNEYDWYLLAENNETEEVTSIEEIKKGNKEAEYIFSNKEEKEETFIEVETTDEEIKLGELQEKEQLKEAIKNAISEYKTDDKIITEEVKKNVEERVKEIEETKKNKEEMQNASLNFIQAGNYTLKYGKYVGYNYETTDNPNSRYDIIIELKSDETYAETDKMSSGKEEKFSGTYSIVDASTFGMAGKVLKFNDDRGMFLVTGNNEFSFIAGTGAKFEYQEETTSISKLVVKTANGDSKTTVTDEGIKVGTTMIKYGKYENKLIASQVSVGNTAYSILTIKPDGKFHIKANVDISTGNVITPMDEEGTFYIEENVEEYPGIYSDFINFKTESGTEFTLYTVMSNQWTGYEYVGE